MDWHKRRLVLLNLLIGFTAVSVAMAGGFFLAQDAEWSLQQAGQLVLTWPLVLRKSAHSHLNLFGYLHVLFGLTLSYSSLPLRWQRLQTCSLASGTLAMGLGLTLRSFQAPPSAGTIQLIAIVMAFCLTAAMVAIVGHVVGLAMAFMLQSLPQDPS
jgi:hypothetical protein